MKTLALFGALLGSLALAPGVARAEKVKLEMMVVEASQQGNAVDPKLAHMRDDFKNNGMAFSSYKLAGEKTVTVDLKTATEIPLPTGKAAKLTPTSVDQGKINIHAELPSLTMDYSVANGGRNFLGVGNKGKDKVFLVVKHELVK